jgi:hypothetical protein
MGKCGISVLELQHGKKVCEDVSHWRAVWNYNTCL